MAIVTEYLPNAIILPDNLGLRRDFLDARSHVPEVPFLDESDYKEHDTTTVFYDVFCGRDGKSIRALGPPFVNLAQHLLPIQAYLTMDGVTYSDPLPHKMENRDRVVFHTFVLPQKIESTTNLQVKFIFANGWDSSVDIKPFYLPDVFLQFTTIQKDNPIKWIIDWINYNKNLGVERIVLYDNNSVYYAELKQRLETEIADVSVVLVNWPSTYGTSRSGYNQFCQAAQNNHAHQCLGFSEWCGFLDVDEYLVCPDKERLQNKLKKAPFWRALFRINNYLVPNIQPKQTSSLYTVRDYLVRNKALRNKAYKYIARIKGLKEAKTHNGRVNWGYLRFPTSPKNMVFFHYVPLTTNWKPHDNRLKLVEFDDALHVQDKSVAELLDDAN